MTAKVKNSWLPDSGSKASAPQCFHAAVRILNCKGKSGHLGVGGGAYTERSNTDDLAIILSCMNTYLRLNPNNLAPAACGRTASLLGPDFERSRARLRESLEGRRVLVIGGAGSIGAASVRILSTLDVEALHVIDTNENQLAELVRGLRSRSEGLAIRDFRVLPLDLGSNTTRAFLFAQEPYDYVLNFAAIKHVRTERDSYSVVRMLETNVVAPERLQNWLCDRGGTQRYFSVSTDKAANPVNLMGASKRLMEHSMFGSGRLDHEGIAVTSARFANVAFSKGSLLDAWRYRIQAGEPIAVPSQTRRYFLSLREAGELCVLAASLGQKSSLLIPSVGKHFRLELLEDVAVRFLDYLGFRAVVTESETEAKRMAARSETGREYPLLATALDTTGEKAFEEFVGTTETARQSDWEALKQIEYCGGDQQALDDLWLFLRELVSGVRAIPPKEELVAIIAGVIPEMNHSETGKNLDQRL